MTRIAQYLEINKGSKSLTSNEFDGMNEHQNLKMLKYLKNIENGFFVECGAGYGENTEILEGFGWTGMLIEPSETLYNFCKNRRPNCIVENYALVSFNYNKSVINVQGVGSYKEPRIGTNMQIPENIIVSDDDATREFKVATFDELARKHNVTKVDVFFLDVEGFELELLKGINFDTVDISFMCIEVNNTVYTLENMDSFMYSKGFERICNLSGYTFENFSKWKGHHQDYLYAKLTPSFLKILYDLNKDAINSHKDELKEFANYEAELLEKIKKIK